MFRFPGVWLAASVPTQPPTSFTAGDTVSYTTIPADYPPSEGWTMSVRVVLADQRINASVTDDDASQYTVTFAADDFKAIVKETEARLVATVAGSGSYDGERYTVYDAALTILPNPETTTLDDARSDAEIELAAVKAAIAASTNGKIASYAIGGRTVQYNTLKDLYQRQAVLEARIRSEQGRGFRRRVVSFVGTG